MDIVVLHFEGRPIRAFVVPSRGLEVGRGAGADIVVHDEEVAARHARVAWRDGGLVVEPIGEGAEDVRPLPLGVLVPIGARHALSRGDDATRAGSPEPRTEALSVRDDHDPSSLWVVVGRGEGARRMRVGDRPWVIGSSPEADLVLYDRAVSGRHCRIEATPRGVCVRDLGSRNGTYVAGVRADVATLAVGARLRVGRTDLRVAAGAAKAPPEVGGLVAASASMREVLARVERFAQLPYPVLVVGETGSGKEGVARALHERGPRRERPFVAVNAGAFARDLVESELFGHERGAFTGAVSVRRGVFEQADGGTLFLDELGELPLDLQARLLRVLESGEVRRVGAERAITVDVRLVAATHRDLPAMVASGAFRRDLYYRVAQLSLVVPPLRTRPDDVRALALHFLARARDELGGCSISEAAFAPLLAHRWPGNVRELRNVVLAAAAASPGVVDEGDILAAIGGLSTGPTAAPRASAHRELAFHAGNVSAAARALGIPRTTLRDRLRRER